MRPTAAASMPFVPRTKLRPPRLPDDLLRRPRLIEKLNRPQTLSLVIAPAGHGKTALVSTWLVQSGLPFAWLSLDRDDDSLPAFLAGMGAALRQLAPTLEGELRQLLQAPTGEPHMQQVLPLLLNTLDALEDRFVVVLDDYHHVHDAALHRLICRLLEHPPRALQLVLTARYDPPLPPRVRYSGGVTTIRARELCFTEQEAQAFLGQFVAEPLATQAVAGLVQKSEGWAVALRLAGALIHQRQDAGALDRALQICERSLLDYLDAEVIGQLPEDMQAFLVRTSGLNLLNPALCDAVLGAALGQAQSAVASAELNERAGDSKGMLRMLVDKGVFVEQLDEAGEWFRCHELFRHLLQRRLRSTHGAQEIEAFLQRAAVWHEEHDHSAYAAEVRYGGSDHRDVPAGRSPTAPGSCADSNPVTGADPLAYWERAVVKDAAFAPIPDARGATGVKLPAAAETRVEQGAKRQPTTGEQASVLLTYREMDVLALICERLTNKEIAYKLGIATETVRQHTVHVYRKLGVDGRRQAIVQARALGLTLPAVSSNQVVPQGRGASRTAAAGAVR